MWDRRGKLRTCRRRSVPEHARRVPLPPHRLSSRLPSRRKTVRIIFVCNMLECSFAGWKVHMRYCVEMRLTRKYLFILLRYLLYKLQESLHIVFRIYQTWNVGKYSCIYFKLFSSKCSRIQRSCPISDWDCLHQPSTYSYNFITFVSNLFLPMGSVSMICFFFLLSFTYDFYNTSI